MRRRFKTNIKRGLSIVMEQRSYRKANLEVGIRRNLQLRKRDQNYMRQNKTTINNKKGGKRSRAKEQEPEI